MAHARTVKSVTLENRPAPKEEEGAGVSGPSKAQLQTRRQRKAAGEMVGVGRWMVRVRRRLGSVGTHHWLSFALAPESLWEASDPPRIREPSVPGGSPYSWPDEPAVLVKMS